MSKFFQVFLAIAMLAAFPMTLSAQEEAPAPSEIRLPEDVLFSVIIPDISELKEQWNASAFSKAWNSPEAERIREAFDAEWKEFQEGMSADIGVEPQQLFEHFEGFASFMITDLQVNSDSGEDTMDVALVAELPKEKREEVQNVIAKLMESVPDDAKKSVEEFRDIKVYQIAYEETVEETDWTSGLDDAPVSLSVQYAFHNNLFVIGEGSNEPVKKILTNLLSEAGTSLEENTDFRQLENVLETEGEIIVWANVPGFINKALAESPEGAPMLDTMGVKDIGAAMYMVDLHSGGLSDRGAWKMPREKKGIIEMLYSGQPLSLNNASIVPSDTFNYIGYSADVGGMWSSMRSMLQQINPESDSFIAGWITSARQNFAIDIEQDLLNNIQGEHCTYTRPLPSDFEQPEPMMPGMPAPVVTNNVTLLSLTNGQSTVTALNNILAKLKEPPFQLPIESIDQEGMLIWTVSEDTPVPPSRRYALGVTPKFLILAQSLEEAQETVRRVRGEAEDSLASTEDYRKAISGVDMQNLRVFAYTGPGAYENMANQFRVMIDAMNQFAEPGEEIAISAEDIPPATWWRKYFGVATRTISLSPTYMTYGTNLSTN